MFRKRNAMVEMVAGLCWTVMLTVLLGASLQFTIFRMSAAFVEDALAASNLASMLIDVEAYGKTLKMNIISPEDSYVVFQDALKYNLNLNDQWEAANKNLISGPVVIAEYIVYHVDGNDVMWTSLGTEGNGSRIVKDGKGTVCSPDGTVIESESVYSRVRYMVRGIRGIEIEAVKEKTVDVVSNLLPEGEE